MSRVRKESQTRWDTTLSHAGSRRSRFERVHQSMFDCPRALPEPREDARGTRSSPGYYKTRPIKLCLIRPNASRGVSQCERPRRTRCVLAARLVHCSVKDSAHWLHSELLHADSLAVHARDRVLRDAHDDEPNVPRQHPVDSEDARMTYYACDKRTAQVVNVCLDLVFQPG